MSTTGPDGARHGATRIEWNASYVLGVEDIDFQHRYFANLINRLAEELATCDDDPHRRALLNELNAYAAFHFISEENMMRRAGFPLLEQHRRHHRELIDELSAREGLLLLRNSPQAADDVMQFLIAWFTAHTTGEDRRFADFLAGRHP